MNRDSALQLATNAVRACTHLSSLLSVLEEQCEPSEYARLLRSIASACAHIGDEVLTPLFKEHPDVERELDARIEQRGSVI